MDSLSPIFQKALVESLLQDPHYTEIKLQLVEAVFDVMNAEDAQQVLENMSELLEKVKTPDNMCNVWTANMAVIPIMLLMVNIANKIGDKFPQH